MIHRNFGGDRVSRAVTFIIRSVQVPADFHRVASPSGTGGKRETIKSLEGNERNRSRFRDPFSGWLDIVVGRIN